MKTTRPAVSHDTRVLLTIVAISLATLWALARLRFPERPPSPVPPVFAQLAPPSAFEDIARTIALLETRLRSSLLPLRADGSTVIAFRFRPELGVAPVHAGGPVQAMRGDVEATTVGYDRAADLAVVRLPATEQPAVSLWTVRPTAFPRFLVAVDGTATSMALRPVFIGALQESASPIWPGAVWTIPEDVGVGPDTFLFTLDGALAGLVVQDSAQLTLVSAEGLLEVADRLTRPRQRAPGYLGVEVQPLTPQVSVATGQTTGVVVSWVDPRGPAASELRITDVISGLEQQPLSSPAAWSARVDRLAEGDLVQLELRRGATTRTATIAATGIPTPPARPLGLGLRSVARTGVEVVRVDAGSAAAAAGLRIGDLITVIGGIERPTQNQATRAFANADPERPILIAVTRAGAHQLLTLTRTW